MSKPVDEPITMLQPTLRDGGRFRWRDREVEVGQVGGSWAHRGRWWLGEGYRRYFRVTTLDNMTLDLCYDEGAQSWSVAERMD